MELESLLCCCLEIETGGVIIGMIGITLGLAEILGSSYFFLILYSVAFYGGTPRSIIPYALLAAAIAFAGLAVFSIFAHCALIKAIQTSKYRRILRCRWYYAIKIPVTAVLGALFIALVRRAPNREFLWVVVLVTALLLLHIYFFAVIAVLYEKLESSTRLSVSYSAVDQTRTKNVEEI